MTACSLRARAAKLLQERGLPVTGIPCDEHQPKLTGQHCWDKLTVERRFHVQLLAQGIETTGAAITALTLTVERQEIRHVWVCIRFRRIETSQ